MTKMIICIVFISVLNTCFMDLFNVTLAVNVVASSVLYISCIAFHVLFSTILLECTSIYESKLARQYAPETHEQ